MHHVINPPHPDALQKRGNEADDVGTDLDDETNVIEPEVELDQVINPLHPGALQSGGDAADDVKTNLGAGINVIEREDVVRYRSIIATNEERLEIARRQNDQSRIDRLTRDIEVLRAFLSAKVDKFQRPRQTGSTRERKRKRKAILNRISDARKEIDRIHPALGQHLLIHLHTGGYCYYTSAGSSPWKP